MAAGEIGLQTSVWLVYLACCVAMVALLWRWAKPASLLARSLLVMLAVLLLLPFGVPGEQSLAPAWIVVVFELGQGRDEVPLAIAKLLSALLFLLGLITLGWRRFRARSQSG